METALTLPLPRPLPFARALPRPLPLPVKATRFGLHTQRFGRHLSQRVYANVAPSDEFVFGPEAGSAV